jgi:hypothetical protein
MRCWPMAASAQIDLWRAAAATGVGVADQGRGAAVDRQLGDGSDLSRIYTARDRRDVHGKAGASRPTLAVALRAGREARWGRAARRRRVHHDRRGEPLHAPARVASSRRGGSGRRRGRRWQPEPGRAPSASAVSAGSSPLNPAAGAPPPPPRPRWLAYGYPNDGIYPGGRAAGYPVEGDSVDAEGGCRRPIVADRTTPSDCNRMLEVLVPLSERCEGTGWQPLWQPRRSYQAVQDGTGWNGART